MFESEDFLPTRIRLFSIALAVQLVSIFLLSVVESILSPGASLKLSTRTSESRETCGKVIAETNTGEELCAAGSYALSDTHRIQTAPEEIDIRLFFFLTVCKRLFAPGQISSIDRS